jgi:CBS domain containing-hemolysin-like protein
MTLDQFIAIVWKLFGVMVLVFVNGFFVAAEFALVKIRETQLTPLIAKGHKRARVAQKILKDLDRSLSAAQVGITLASLGLGWIGEPVFAAMLQPVYHWLHIDSESVRHTISVIVGFSAITFLHISAGEQAPKWMAIQRPLPTALWIAWPLHIFHRMAYPFIWILNWSSLWVLQQIGIEAGSEHESHSEEELRLLFSTTQQQAGATTLGREIVLNALALRRRVARDIMRPRQEIVGMDTENTIAECIEIAERTRFSRFPILEHGSLDHTRGVIHIKDLYAARNSALRAADLVPLARNIIFIPETARLERLLEFFLGRRVHLAMVVDEFGGTIGMVTLENVIEQLVGQIQDEFDQEKPLLTKTSDLTWAVDGSLPLHDLATLVGDSLEEEGITTASGWITHKLGGFPKTGDVVKLDGSEVRVEQMDGPRVARLTVAKNPPPEATESL